MSETKCFHPSSSLLSFFHLMSCTKKVKNVLRNITCPQCCGSGIRCFFTPRIRDPDPGSGMIFFRIPDPYHVLKFNLYLLDIYLKILPVKMAKKRKNKILFNSDFNKDLFLHERGKYIPPPPLFCRIQDKIRIRIRDTKKWSDPDPGPGINIPDRQHCLSLVSPFLHLYFATIVHQDEIM
jgi:hypothetical protein